MSAIARNGALTVALVLAFAALVTVHAATLFGLTRRGQHGAALGALVFPPLSPYWAFTRGMRARAVAWVAFAVLYGALLVLAR